MRIMPVTSTKHGISNKKNNTNPLSYNDNVINKNDAINFKAYTFDIKKWDDIANRILDSNSSEIKILGEYFHKQSDEVLRTVTKTTKHFFFNDVDTSQKAYKKLANSVDEVRKTKNQLISRISVLGVKEAQGLENISEQKTNLQKFFINPLIAEQQGLKPEIDDGILIYGSSINKDNFINWLSHAAPVNYKEMQFNAKAPLVSLEELVKHAKNGQTAFDITGKRTLLNVKDIDKFLSDFNTPEKRGNIGNFKALAEVLSSDYHTTIITKTDLNPENFESAARARFGIPVDLKDGINKQELEELKSARATVARMNERADKVYDEFQYETSRTYWDGDM